MGNSYNILISKLNGFIRKYYLNQIIKGLIFSVSLVLLLLLVVSVFEFYSWTNTLTRTIVFYAFLFVTSSIIIYYILIPASRLIKLGKTLSHTDAAEIIGKHFPEVSDKLLNTLQLHDSVGESNVELLLASIDQKANDLKLIPFKKAVSYKTNVRYLKYVLPLVLIFTTILLVTPSMVIEPTTRIINHQTEFIKPLPYSLELLNTDFTCAQHTDFIVKIRAEGEEIPAKIWISESGFNYRASETAPGEFEYIFKNVPSDIYFNILTEDAKSSTYHVEVYPQPVIFNFDVIMDYPSYLQIQDEKIENTGDLIVPEGTKINWEIFTRDTRNVEFYEEDSLYHLTSEESNVFKHSATIGKDMSYALVASNKHMRSNDSMAFNIQVIKDQFPSISVDEYKDVNNYGLVNFIGSISDDHGFKSLKFYFRKDSIPEQKWKSESLLLAQGVSDQRFDYMIYTPDFKLGPGESLIYYFEVRDNDAFNGFKRSKSDTYYFRMPDASELEDKIDEATDDFKDKLKESIIDINKLEKQIEDTRMNLFEKKELSWSDKQQLSELLEKEEELNNQLEEIKKLNEDIKELEELLQKKMSPELQEKLQELQELFNKLYDEELQKEIEKLREELEKENINEFLERMKEQNEDLKNDLEQNLELFKQMEFEQKMEEAIDKLEELSEKENKLSEQTANKENTKEEGIEKQEELQKEFRETMKKLDEADQLNKELEDSFNVEIDTASAGDINQEMDDAKGNLDKNKKNKASENQKNASQKMKKMADALSVMMNAAMEEKMGEDIEQVKNMLDNLLDLSFEQEDLMSDLNQAGKNDPKNVEIREKQKGIKDDFVIIHDSLMAMSKRQVAIQPFVVKESDKINNHIDKALDHMQEQQKGQAMSQQQYAMTSINNLSLMLAESMEQMEQSMQMSGSPKEGSKCKNPGQGKSPSMSEIMKMQQGMNQGMQGKMKKNGLDGKEGLNKKSEELARMAAAQGEIRRMLQEFIEQMEAEGGNGSALNKLVEEMQKTEEDIINRRITQQTYERQKNIETRLLKSEKALQEREKEQKRESKEGKNRNSGNQMQDLEYKTKKENQEEILITVPIEVRPYYKKLLKEYLYKLENEKENGKQ